LAFWWLTHANGILLGVPILLAWWYGSFARIREHALEAVALALTVVALGFLLFEPEGGAESARRFLYVPFPVLIWSAFRFRLVGAAAANLFLAIPVMAFTALGRGPFNEVAGVLGPDTLLQLWVFVAVNAVTSLFVAAVVEEREREVLARIAAEEERTRMSERVARARRAESLGVLAGGIAHDFNNLLVSIMGHAELAGLELEGHPAGESVDEIMRASQRAAEICRQMLAYAGRGRVSNSTVDLAEVAAEMTELLSVSFDEATRVEVYLEGRVRPIWGDITQLRRVTLNLLTNASDALPEGRGRIRVSTGPIARHQLSDDDLMAGGVPDEGELVHLTVEDDGSGLDPDLRDRIFEPFFSTKSNSRGLGLAAVLGIVVAHDGLLELRSRPGEGARFRLVFPVTDRESEVDDDDPDTPSTVNGASILVADDEEGVREVVVGMLEGAGASVEAVPDGLEAVRVFGDAPGRFDVVVLDITMPRLGGVEALARIREIRPRMPVVLMTGDVEDADRVAKVHRVPVLMKPFRLYDVTQVVEQARAAAV
ncbi:MAG TPA: ATP-binding protein, partial [Longimicrobiales bacterium]|nr:ATP-binding protein [Longimicrobiales bacterium]